MRRPNARTSRFVGLIALALAAAALMAVPSLAAARCHGGDPGQGDPGQSGDHHGHHGHHHWHHGHFSTTQSGTVTSYDTGTGELVITLNNGKTITGLVTDDTEIENGTTDSLVAGAGVDDVQLHLEEGNAVFDEIVLAPSSEPEPTPTPES